MAFLNETYNIDDLPQGSTGTFEPLPEGWYTATINGAEIKTTKAGTGQYIAVQYGITGPSHQGRVVFGNINVKNPNPKAEEIGRRQLGNLMRAIGLTKVSDTDQLIGGTLSIRLSVRLSEEYGNSNDVQSFKAIAGGIPSMPKATPSPSSSSDKAPPWAAK